MQSSFQTTTGSESEGNTSFPFLANPPLPPTEPETTPAEPESAIAASAAATTVSSVVCPSCGLADDTAWVQCDGCDEWFHWHCVGLTQEPPDNVPWYCPVCNQVEMSSSSPSKSHHHGHHHGHHHHGHHHKSSKKHKKNKQP